MATNTGHIDYNEGAAPATPAASKVRLYAKTDGLLYSKDDAGTETLVSGGVGGGGAVATDAIWDAAGDLAVGSGANTAAKLTIGNAGGVLARINGAVAWNAGTSFPTAATGDRYFRTDRGLEYYYDGTRWLTTTLYTLPVSLYNAALTGQTDPGAETNSGRAMVPYADTYDLWGVEFQATTYVGATNNGSNYYTVRIKWVNAAGTFTTYSSFTTAADTQATYNYHKVSVGAVLDNTAVGFSLTIQDTASPGTIVTNAAQLTYRLVG